MKEQLLTPPPIRAEAPPLRWDADNVIRIGKTRVALDSLVAAFHRGETPEEIAQNYDAITLGEVYRAIGYYLGHQSEIDLYLAKNAKLREEGQREVERHDNPIGIRNRLTARKTKND